MTMGTRWLSKKWARSIFSIRIGLASEQSALASPSWMRSRFMVESVGKGHVEVEFNGLVDFPTALPMLREPVAGLLRTI